MKLFVFTCLIVRTEAMEAAGSPGSIGADMPPAHMQPVPEDGLGMTPTAEILTQLAQNSRVTTNAINQLALVQQEATASASSSTSGSYEGMLSKALEGAVKMLGRPPLFGGGKTEVYDFMALWISKNRCTIFLRMLNRSIPMLSGTWRNLEMMRAYPTALRTMSTRLCQ